MTAATEKQLRYKLLAAKLESLRLRARIEELETAVERWKRMPAKKPAPRRVAS